MSPATAPIGPAWKFETHGNRRSNHRYPLVLEVEYKLLKGHQVVEFGSGFTLNISSSGVLFEANDTLGSTSAIELRLHWPFLLDGVYPLRLVIQGRVIRTHGNRIAISINHHEFYIAKRALEAASLWQRNPV